MSRAVQMRVLVLLTKRDFVNLSKFRDKIPLTRAQSTLQQRY